MTEYRVSSLKIGGASSRILAREPLPIRTCRREQMELSEVGSQLGVYLLQPCHLTSPTLIRYSQLCMASAISSKHLVIFLW
ncbi:hypothetical protein NQZ68_020997 [Dissostichus eleginoides]|nr:hypothetical protein NQZ68_020997 [Dissostichus eleginoides]